MIDFEQMLNGVNMVKVGVFGRLSSRFKAKYEEEKANLLAAAVTNELFSSLPSNPNAERFLKSNRDIIEQELFNLEKDEEIRNAVTQAVRVKMIISHAQGNRTQESLVSPIEKLIKFGILVPGAEAPSPETFLPLAFRFYQSTRRDVHTEYDSRLVQSQQNPLSQPFFPKANERGKKSSPENEREGLEMEVKSLRLLREQMEIAIDTIERSVGIKAAKVGLERVKLIEAKIKEAVEVLERQAKTNALKAEVERSTLLEEKKRLEAEVNALRKELGQEQIRNIAD